MLEACLSLPLPSFFWGGFLVFLRLREIDVVFCCFPSLMYHPLFVCYQSTRTTRGSWWRRQTCHNGTLWLSCPETGCSLRCSSLDADVFVFYAIICLQRPSDCVSVEPGDKWSDGAWRLARGHPDPSGDSPGWFWQRPGCLCPSLLSVSQFISKPFKCMGLIVQKSHQKNKKKSLPSLQKKRGGGAVK